MSQQEQQPIYDARTLGAPRMALLGFQHMFAMFGATVLVPAITGLSVSATLLFAGIGTLIFHFMTKWKVPAFLGSSFAFLGGYASVTEMGVATGMTVPVALTYACLGVFFAGLMYFILAGLVAAFGTRKVMRFFPPIVTGPIIIAIGLNLSGVAINSCTKNWWIALVAILTIIICNIWGKKMIKIIPILLGVVVSYLFAFILDRTADPSILNFQAVKEAPWIGLPFQMENTAFAIFKNPNWDFVLSAIIAIIPISLATMVEHIGDVCAISSTTNQNFLKEPGLHRTLMGDGLATMVASLFGAPANTTYGENTGVLNITKVFDPRVVRIAACLAILFSFSPKFAAVISAMHPATVGGVSLVLYGMISAVGVRNIVENKVDFTNTRNVIIAALVLVLSIGITYGPRAISFGNISFSGLAVAAIVGILLNAILPGKDFEFGKEYEGVVNVSLGGTALDTPEDTLFRNLDRSKTMKQLREEDKAAAQAAEEAAKAEEAKKE